MVETTTYHDVLVATDGGALAEAATRHAIEIASAFDATVHALSVVNTTIAGNYPEERAAAADAIEAVADSAEAAGLDSVTAVREAPRPYAAITDYRRENDLDLVAMGTHGRSGVKRYLLGSVAERVIRTAHVPVLAVPPTEAETGAPDYGTVLVPIDESDVADAAASHGLAVADRFGSTIHTVHATQVEGGDEDRPTASVDRTLTEVTDRARAADLAATDHLDGDDPIPAIESAIDEYGVDLVAMGRHGESTVKRIVLGGITERLLRDVHVPVLVVPPAGD